jgi:dihydroorotate dehydrogenase (NAD+) catalytic subunit
MGLELNLWGIPLRNPVWTASGTCGYGTELDPLGRVRTLGAIVTKAVTLSPRIGNPTPRIQETASGMLNAIGLANVGVEAFCSQKLQPLRGLGPKIFVNVAGSSVEEYVAVIERLEREEGIDGYELNISCPNVKHGGIAFGADPVLAGSVIAAAVKASRRPVIAKLSPNVSDITLIARAAEDAGAAGISLINTLIGMAIDLKRRKPVLANGTGGLSGPAIKPVGVAMTYRCAKAVKIPIIGLGGIQSAEDALEYLMAGASCVQVGTATFRTPAAAANIVDGLQTWMHKEGVKDLTTIIGACHR